MKWPWRRRPSGNDAQAARARDEARRRLQQTRQDWPKVYQARDEFAILMEAALRGKGT